MIHTIYLLEIVVKTQRFVSAHTSDNQKEYNVFKLIFIIIMSIPVVFSRTILMSFSFLGCEVIDKKDKCPLKGHGHGFIQCFVVDFYNAL